MKKKIIVLFLTLFLIQSVSYAAGSPKPRDMKTGILLTAFGSSIPEAQVSFDRIDHRVKQEFPDIPVCWAFTSHMIRNKMAKQGKILDSEVAALARMTDQGFTHVAVQSLHTIRGEEFDDLVRIASAFEGLPGGIKRIVVGAPLLSSQKDLSDAAAAILSNIPQTRKKTEAVVLMGHGTLHPANAFYTAIQYHLEKSDSLVFMGTVDGDPGIEVIIQALAEKKVKKAWLMPFMSVAGDHARNDLAGEESDSWKSMLLKQGIKCEAILKGTAEYDNFLDIWISHLKEAMARLK